MWNEFLNKDKFIYLKMLILICIKMIVIYWVVFFIRVVLYFKSDVVYYIKIVKVGDYCFKYCLVIWCVGFKFVIGVKYMYFDDVIIDGYSVLFYFLLL